MKYSIVDQTTGRILAKVSCSAVDAKKQARAGQAIVEGHFDHLCERVDTEALADLQALEDAKADSKEIAAVKKRLIVNYQPLKPSDEHEWNGTRWVLPEVALQRDEADRQARTAIAILEARQHRRVRELLAASDPQVKAIDDQIAAERTKLKSR